MVSLQEVVVLIAGTVNFAYDALVFILEVSTFIGSVIVNQIYSALENISQILRLAVVLLQVLYEDEVVFFEDLAEKSSYAIFFIGSGISEIGESLVNIYEAGVNGINVFTNEIFGVFSKISLFLKSSCYVLEAVALLIVDGFLLVGNSVWLAVTKLPIELFMCFIEILQQIQTLLKYVLELFQSFHNIVICMMQTTMDLILRIPYSSVIGGIIAVLSFLYACAHFTQILSFALQAVVAGCNFMSLMCYNLWTGHFLTRKSFISLSYKNDLNDRYIEEKLCIVCKEGLKEVMLLPCRHVCLCSDCRPYIVRNHKLCPLCRTYIQTTMKVYI